MLIKENIELAHRDYLDGWRGLAIVFLLIGHFFPVPGINFGVVGVNFFFVLSGYLMGQLLFVKNTPIPIFYRRRISRIFPAHIVFILVIVVFFVFRGDLNISETITALFFVNNYFPGEIGNNTMPFGHIWSLSVEEHSYIILSLCALWVRKKAIDALLPVSVVTACIVAAILWYALMLPSSALYEKWLHTEVSAYGIFISVCLLLFFRRYGQPRVSFAIVPALMLAGVLFNWWSIPRPIATIAGVGALALAVNFLSTSPVFLQQLFSIKPLRMIGLWSFSIYLWQQPFYLAAHRGELPVFLAIFFAICCGVCSYYLLEKPMRAYLNTRWGAGSTDHGDSPQK